MKAAKNNQGQRKLMEAVIRRAKLREEQQRITESDNPDWDRWSEIEDEIEASKGLTMKRKAIKFNGDYPKLHGQTSAELIAVRDIRIDRDTPA